MVSYIRKKLPGSTWWLYISVTALSFNLCYLHTCAQQLSFQSFNASQGLSQNSIYSIAETIDGFIWLGTQDGLHRFDGRDFVQVNASINKSNQYLPLTPSSKMITALFADPGGFLWIGTTSEILLYDPILNQYSNPAAKFKNFAMVATPYITNIIQDGHENVWITTQTDGLFCYNKQQHQMILLQHAPEKIVSVCISSNNNIIVAGEKDIYTYIQGEFVPFNLAGKLPLLQKAVITECKIIRDKFWLILNTSKIILLDTAITNSITYTLFNETYKSKNFLREPRIIHQSDSNTVWIGSRSDGLLKVDIETGAIEHSGRSNNHNDLKSQFVLSFYSTKNHKTWIGLSGGGIAQYDPQKIKFGLWRNEAKAGGLPEDNMLLSLFSDNDEDFYAGTLYGGLMQRNIKTGYHKYFQPPLNSSTASGARNIYQVISGTNHLLWMSTWGGLYSFNRNEKQFKQYAQPTDGQTRELYALIKLKTADKILTGGQAGGLRLFNTNNLQWEACPDRNHFLNNHILRVRYMQELDDGNVLMSTEKLNLVKYNYHSGIFTTYPQLQKISGSSRHFVLAHPYIWIATDNGLIQANANSMEVVKLWNKQNALPNDYIYAVATDSKQRVWISSNGGIASLNPQTGICEKFTEEDGLQAMEFNTASCYKDKKGNLWFGGINGMNMINPEQPVSQQNIRPPLITNISIMNMRYVTDSAIPYIHRITLPYNQNFVGFEFQSPDNTQKENVSYEYMLSGVDTGWVSNDDRNYVNYTQLDPGLYELKIRAISKFGHNASAATKLMLTITPPWFKGWWFYTSLLAVIITIVYAFINYRISQVKKMEWLKQHISANLHDDIGASLSSIHILAQLLQQTTDVQTRNKCLQQIDEQTTSVIASLRDIVWSINPKNDKLDIIVGRMKRYAAELLEAKNIDFEFETDTRADDEITDINIRQNLYLIFKEAVNNLVKYSDAGKVLIKLYKEYNMIMLEVEDNGVGFNPLTITMGNGINNMERRAKLGRGNFQIISAPGKGTHIKVSLRL